MRNTSVLLLVLTTLIFSAACRNSSQQSSNSGISDGRIQLTMEPEQPAVGASQVTIVVEDSFGSPVGDAALALRGDMTHAGMLPVTVEGATAADGSFQTEIDWTMAGDWIMTVEATLPDGQVLTREIDLTVAP